MSPEIGGEQAFNEPFVSAKKASFWSTMLLLFVLTIVACVLLALFPIAGFAVFVWMAVISTRRSGGFLMGLLYIVGSIVMVVASVVVLLLIVCTNTNFH